VIGVRKTPAPTAEFRQGRAELPKNIFIGDMVNLDSTIMTGKGTMRYLSCRFFYSLYLVAALSVGGWGAEPNNAPPKKPALGSSQSTQPKPHRRHKRVKRTVPSNTSSTPAAKAIPQASNEASPTSNVSAPAQNVSSPAQSTSSPDVKGPAASEVAPPAPVKLGQRESARVESARRKVEVKLEGQEGWQKASANKILKTQDEIRTGKQSLARVKLADGSKILLLQNSQAEMEELSSIQKAIKLIRGRIRAIVTRMKGEGSFKIKTPIGVASVRGTDFEVEFSEESQEMMVEVRKGSVGVSKLGDLAKEVIVKPGEQLRFGLEGEIGDPIRMGAVPLNRVDVRAEVVATQDKDRVVSMAAEESRNADYQVGKSMVDVDGQRVRIEEYIMRPRADQFKLVVLNERPTRFDYFYYKGTFNTTLPTDLSIALGQMGGRLKDAPDYYLKEYEMYMSNTHDSIKDSATGGHLVKIELVDDDYILTDKDESSITKTVPAAAQVGDYYNVYNPIKDTLNPVNADEVNAAKEIAVNDGGTYRNLRSGDIYWKTRFNNYNYYINNALKTSYAPASGITRPLSAAYETETVWVNKPIYTASEYPSGTGSLYNRLTLFYPEPDGKKTVFDNYIIDDHGNVAPTSAFSGIATSAAYQNELVKWNYQQKVKADEMSDSINLVIDPRIGIMSGMMQ